MGVALLEPARENGARIFERGRRLRVVSGVAQQISHPRAGRHIIVHDQDGGAHDVNSLAQNGPWLARPLHGNVAA